ncbi:hypothetical protein DAKH74_049410 [Maudiozyma humilis]|uniref:CCHC-type domain-containing protein n=1 Tax=Maudiozyma humilis TaxID=51915 RepID=A0AAV5S6W5_MAUHU|nr:hypothetical protein DAKH74_049410 [Kazachstania humilis]
MTKEQLLVHIFAKGLPPSIRNHVLIDAPDTLAGAIGAAAHRRSEWRSMHPKSASSRPPEKSGRVSKPYDRRVTCNFCGKPGHLEAVCRAKSAANRVRPPPSFFEAYPDQTTKGSKN